VIEAERRAVQPKASEHTWVYQLDWPSPVDGGKWKAHHGLDVPLVFDSCPLVPEMVGTGPDAQRVADQMSEALLAFARTGNPNTPAIPKWPTYDLKQRPTMLFDVNSKVVDDPRGDERRMFEKVPYVQPGT
jgi:para-nitrobenzyl esterase